MKGRRDARPARLDLRLRTSLARLLPRPLRHRLLIAYGDDAMQRIRLFLPSRRGFPIAVCIYGSYWHSRGGASWLPIGAMLREHGFGAVLVHHRLWPPHRWPAQIDDVALALAWTRDRIADFGGDPERIALLGHSSGAQLALLTALDPTILGVAGVNRNVVRAITALGAPTDLVPRADGTGFGNLFLSSGAAEVFHRDTAVMRRASPCNHVGPGLPPIQLIIGEHDLPMFATDMQRFAAACEAAGNRVASVTATGKDHMGLVAALKEGGQVQREVLGFLDRAFRHNHEPKNG